MNRLVGLAARDRFARIPYRARVFTPPELLPSIGYALQVFAVLQTLWPRNREISYRWVMARNRALNQSRPIDLMCAPHNRGRQIVSRYLTRHLNS